MDMLCLRCGEPWVMHHVIHDEPEEFERKGCIISMCPSCQGKVPELTEAQKDRLDQARTLAVLLGNDIDGYVVELEDNGLV